MDHKTKYKSSSIKVLEENRSKPLWPWVGQHFFLDVTDIAQMIKEENRQTEFHQYFILLLLLILATLHSMWNLSSLTRDQTCAPLHWKRGVLTTGTPGKSFIKILKVLFFRGYLWRSDVSTDWEYLQAISRVKDLPPEYIKNSYN